MPDRSPGPFHLRLSRRLFLGGGLAALAGAGHAGAPEVSLRPRLRPTGFTRVAARPAQELVEAARLGGHVSYAVVDVASGLMLESREGFLGQPPASVTKAVTALYALDALGPDYRFETTLLATGPVENGVLDGDLVLAGGGDPTLDTDALAEMAAALKARGIREVTGRLRAWGGALPFERVIDPTQPEHVGYNPSISGLNLNFNRVHFEWKRAGASYTVAMDARSGRYRPAVEVARMSVAQRALPVYTYADQGDHDAWTVARDALGESGARWLPVRKPEVYAGEVFATFARSHGLVLKLGEPLGDVPQGRVLVSHSSAPLTELLQAMLKYSTNLTAEIVGMTATVARTGEVASLRASAAEMSTWARSDLGMPGTDLHDHSGLNEASRLTAPALANALARVHREGLLAPILKPIPMRRPGGEVDPRHPLKVTAKTGTLYFVSSLAGYATAPDGTLMAFTILTANPELRDGFDSRTGLRPEGSRGWNRRSKALQQGLLERWSALYGA